MAQIDFNLRGIYRIVRKRKWIILFAPLLMGISAYFLTQLAPPIYTAEALTKITRTSTVAGLITEMVTYSSYDNMATQIMVIRSRPVVENVARKLNMIRQPEDVQPAITALRSSIGAAQRDSSDILGITGSAGTPEQAILLANTVVDAYIEANNADRDSRIKATLDLLRRRDSEVTAELNQAEKALIDFKRREGNNLSLDPNMGVELDQGQVLYSRTVENLNATIDTINRINQDRDFASYPQTYFAIEDPVGRQMNDHAVQFATNWVEFRNKRNDLLKSETEAAPQVQQLDGQLRNEEQRLIAQLNRLLGRLKLVVADNMRLLASTEEHQKLIARKPELTAQLDNLTLVAREKQELAALLRRQLQDAEIQQRDKVQEVTIVERAHIATTQPNRIRAYQALIGALIGILLGGVFSFVLEAKDTALGPIEDVEQRIHSVVLGTIPHLEQDDIKDRIRIDKGTALPPEDVERFARLVTHFDPKSIGSEAYRTLRTSIAGIMSRNGGKIIMLSSSMIQEGKTTSCCNIATAFAQSGKRTLLIDADLRRPAVDKTFGVARVPGLTDLLLDTRDPLECYRTIDDIMLGKFGLKLAQATPGLDYLTILPAGRTVDNPAELLSAPAMDKLLEEGRARFDVIIMDVSSVLPVGDAFALAPKVDGIILAYQIERVARDDLKRTRTRIESMGGKVWGVILNDIRSEIDYRAAGFSYYDDRSARHLDEPKGVVDRITAAFRGRSSRPKASPKTSMRITPSDSPPVVSSSGSMKGGGAQDVRDIMSLTDDDQ